jgi:hypothetical protein
MARGRRSAATLSTVASSIDRRPSAPLDLTAAQKATWELTIGSEAIDQFKTAALRQLLKDYCRHVATADFLSEEINAASTGCLRDLDELRRFNRLLAMRDRETKAIADKATKLRLTNQSRYTPRAASTAAQSAGVLRPWEE